MHISLCSVYHYVLHITLCRTCVMHFIICCTCHYVQHMPLRITLVSICHTCHSVIYFMMSCIFYNMLHTSLCCIFHYVTVSHCLTHFLILHNSFCHTYHNVLHISSSVAWMLQPEADARIVTYPYSMTTTPGMSSTSSQSSLPCRGPPSFTSTTSANYNGHGGAVVEGLLNCIAL